MNRSAWIWAVRMLRSRHTHTSVKRHIRSALLGITFSIIPLVLVVILANGMIDGITRIIIEIDSGAAKAYQLREHDEETIAGYQEEISRQLGYDTQLLYEGSAVLFSQRGNQMVTVRGVEPDSYHMKNLDFQQGEPGVSRQEIVVSPQIAQQLMVEKGDRLTLLTYVETGDGDIRYKPTLVTVGGIATSGYHLLDEGMVYIHREYGPRVFTNPDALVLRLLPSDADLRRGLTDPPGDELRNILGDGWRVTTWHEQYAGVYQNYQSTKTLLYFVMGLIVIAAGVHISSCSLMIILEHTSAIGILRSMGVPLRRIRTSFVYTGMLIGIIGTLIGIGVGILLGSQLNHILQLLQIGELQGLEYYLDTIDIRIPGLEIFGVFLYGVVVSCISSIVPTRHLKRMSPLKIITSS